MKKGWKTFWVIMASMAVLGLVLTILGVSLGASTRVIRNELGFGPFFDYDFDNDDLGNAKVTEYDDIRSLDVKYYYGKLEILTDSNAKKIKVEEITRTGRSADYEVEDGELQIESHKGGISWFNTRGNRSMRITIPQKLQLDEVDLELGAGQLQVNNLSAKEIHLEVGAGEGKLEDFQGDYVTIKNGAGRVEATGDATRNLDVETGVGEVVVGVKGDSTDYNYSVSSGIGEVRIGETSYGGIGSDGNVSNNSDRDIKVECGVGKVAISFNQ
ncbi:DUF4097 and DUF4098 domain-containing protein YvlB [Aequitasia blattaphilus]|uniref:DUF4097 family beta strand repeat-containing protein n=1 Tax=Aequitasia blattaphilus TaxID=2949332 RepID=A0ABT1EAI1_9FIRM|nr:DUF4097 family beta strand repeat-containing protein [Aequitasia blattaphilus]MCP1102624.1 DUF4097 family beta strand repeat-containing protein [Aequitasia blattaphilus]MCR8615264.1 DUF4097 family beta strand repeat-containing protein [Aequitasia blattaphilus]